MSPLKEGQQVYSDEAHKPLNWWRKLFGFGNSYTVSNAAINGGAEIVESEPRYPGQPNQRTIVIGDFPNLIKGFQKTGSRPDGVHFHPWALNVETEADEFEVTPPSRKKLVYSKRQ